MNKNEITFFKKMGNYYYYINDTSYELSKLYLLEDKVTLPTKLIFNNISLRMIKEIIKKLNITNIVKASIEQIGSRDYIVILSKKEKKEKVYTYKVYSNQQLYGRRCNPYILTNINNKKVLLEIDLELAKEQEGDYYFLWNDLSEQEKKMYGYEMNLIDVDYVYSYNKDIMNKIYEKNTMKKVKKIRRTNHEKTT